MLTYLNNFVNRYGLVVTELAHAKYTKMIKFATIYGAFSNRT